MFRDPCFFLFFWLKEGGGGKWEEKYLNYIIRNNSVIFYDSINANLKEYSMINRRDYEMQTDWVRNEMSHLT